MCILYFPLTTIARHSSCDNMYIHDGVSCMYELVDAMSIICHTNSRKEIKHRRLAPS